MADRPAAHIGWPLIPLEGLCASANGVQPVMPLKVPGAISTESIDMSMESPNGTQPDAGQPSPTRRARIRGSERGTTSVELALVLPVFLLLVFGLVELSVALYDQAVLVNASREGARAGIVLRNPKLTTADIQQVVLNYTNGSLITFGATATPVVTVTQSSPAVFPNPLKVQVDYTYTGLGLGSMMSAVTQPLVLSATASMINE